LRMTLIKPQFVSGALGMVVMLDIPSIDLRRERKERDRQSIDNKRERSQ
jgi:hypothetical protein